MRFRGNDILWNPGPGIELVAIKIAQLKTGNQQSSQTTIQISLFDFTSAYSLWQMFVFRSALHISTRQHRFRTGLSPILCHIMPTGQEIANRTTVAGNQSVESPLVTQYLLFITSLRTAGLAVNALIGAHHLSDFTLLYQSLESRQIGLPQITLWQILDIELMTVPLRTAMHSKVLGTSQQFAIFAHA